ncbi:cation-translocating P-type ATPase [Anaerotalea alkaliphila]|uniref:Cation-translocating P-type ATPase n=1 Tax=Anaerotalea alkaliphila TaxID=2662126 RepID=A0A7X5HVL9_9FIRM|nr:cation-translocating P-type ATPase [Anaerotalea alkaliphila]NDL67393.1 cation-translocating P-type ATPase [Anaerotalea alkaliphila]
MEKQYKWSREEAYERMGTAERGLDPGEVEGSRNAHGANRLPEAKRPSVAVVFLSQFKDFLVWILLVAAGISAAMGKMESTLVIVAVVILNAVLGTVQHVKAEKSIQSLKALSSPNAKVLREGLKQEIPSAEVVVGDLLLLEAGDFVGADGRVVESNSLQVNESALTGESVSVEKSVEALDGGREEVSLGDRVNMAFSGSHVTYGRGMVLVTGVGEKTEIGKIALLLEQAKEKETPLQRNLDAFGKKLAFLILLISGLVFGLSLYRGNPLMDALLFAISLAVAAIPEALSSIVTIVLSLGTRKLAQENAIVRKLHSVESLGSVSVICSDKTGTLTQNKMTVQKLYFDGRMVEAGGLDLARELERKLLLSSILCNDAVSDEGKQIGDPTEIALVHLGDLYGMDELEARKRHVRLAELPFDSDRKLMSTLNQVDDRRVLFTKGALDVMLQRATHVQVRERIRPIGPDDLRAMEEANHSLSDQGLRVLAFACREFPEQGAPALEDEDGLTLLGLVAMMDPPRLESAQAVADCVRAGIKPVMITGDHKVTASAIARQIGILREGDKAVEGAEIEHLTDQELRERVPEISVYARVSPEHKIRIVQAWQDLGHVVAMTGDGVNDAPALKRADIGIAMGIAGTEVAKDAASMVLMDDNFSTIVKAIGNGRSIYGNIKNAVKFLLSGNTAGILTVLAASLAGLPAPFAPVHLLFINLLTDSLPAIAIGLEPAHGHLMEAPPRDAKKPILDRAFGMEVLLEGLVIGAVTLAAYGVGLSTGSHGVAMTMAFATLSLSRLVHGFNCRMDPPLGLRQFFGNAYSLLAVGLGVLLLLGVLQVGFLRRMFEVADLSGGQYLLVAGLSLLPLLVVQAGKRLRNLFGWS